MRAAIEACTCDSRKSLVEVQLFASKSANEYDNQIAEKGDDSFYLDEEIAIQRRDLDVCRIFYTHSHVLIYTYPNACMR